MRTLRNLLSDLHFAGRALLKRPGFTVVVVATLALGIGANAAIFSVTHAVLLRPLPYRDASHLVRVLADSVQLGVEGAGLAAGDFIDFRQQSRTLAGLSAYNPQSYDLTGGGDRPEVIQGAQVSQNLFSTLGVHAALGRTFLPDEEKPGHDKVALLSDGFWRRHFGADPGVLGRAMKLDGEAYTVVGVMPADFGFPAKDVAAWVPLAFPADKLDRMSHYLGVVGRLRKGVALPQAGEEMSGLAAALERDHPETNKEWKARVVRLSDHLVRKVRPALLVLSGAVFLLLLIACANLGNLLLARGAARQRETAVRAALGAPRLRLIRLFIVESTLLSLCGGAIGLLLAVWGVRFLVAASPAQLPRASEIGIDGTVILFALMLSLLAGIVFGAVPALQLSSPDLNSSFRGGEGQGGRRASRLRSSFVVSEVALALILLIGAGLMFQGFLRLGRVDPGFKADNVLALQIALSSNRYPEDANQVQFFDRVLDEMKTLPGVRSAAAGSAIPLSPDGQNLLPFEVEGGESPEAAKGVFASFSAVTPDYFSTLGVPLLQGRTLTSRDSAAAPPVLVINQVMARRFWPRDNPVGRHLRMTIRGTKAVSYEVVGVVGSARQQSLSAEPDLAIYAPFRQVPHTQMFVILRTGGAPLGLAEAAQSRVFTVDANQPVLRTLTLDQLVGEAGTPARFYTTLLGFFATAGLILSAIGIYGVLAYAVSLRRREMSVRVAMGARSEDIFRLVIGGSLKLTLLGVALGLAGALGLTRLLASLLYGVSPNDPLTFSLVPLFLLGVALLASYLPARRAVQVDPMLPLRQA
ncbi:MAG TPA: ABC transporter permease [Thermoanaerobaculia bacterium]|jgi:putative ABC transport system permease protein|nr:ABC transporter permease [Thermoanaerobaculia bacterium]